MRCLGVLVFLVAGCGASPVGVALTALEYGKSFKKPDTSVVDGMLRDELRANTEKTWREVRQYLAACRRALDDARTEIHELRGADESLRLTYFGIADAMDPDVAAVVPPPKEAEAPDMGLGPAPDRWMKQCVSLATEAENRACEADKAALPECEESYREADREVRRLRVSVLAWHRATEAISALAANSNPDPQPVTDP